MSRETDGQRDCLKLLAYGYLASFWIDISTKEYDDEAEAKSILRLQESLIREFESTLREHFDEAAMNEFRNYTQRYRVGISH